MGIPLRNNRSPNTDLIFRGLLSYLLMQTDRIEGQVSAHTFVGFYVYGMMVRFVDGENSNYLSNVPFGFFNLIFVSPL